MHRIYLASLVSLLLFAPIGLSTPPTEPRQALLPTGRVTLSDSQQFALYDSDPMYAGGSALFTIPAKDPVIAESHQGLIRNSADLEITKLKDGHYVFSLPVDGWHFNGSNMQPGRQWLGLGARCMREMNSLHVGLIEPRATKFEAHPVAENDPDKGFVIREPVTGLVLHRKKTQESEDRKAIVRGQSMVLTKAYNASDPSQIWKLVPSTSGDAAKAPQAAAKPSSLPNGHAEGEEGENVPIQEPYVCPKDD